MKIGIISTLERGIWGGCDPLWLAAAEDALEDGHEVGICLSRGPATISRTEQVAKAGAKLFWRKQQRNFYWRLRNWLIKRLKNCGISPLKDIAEMWRSASSELRQLFEWKPDVIIVNLSVIYDCHSLPNLAEELRKYKVPYLTIVHVANDFQLPGDESRSVTKEVELNAKAALFVSVGTQRMVERHLACALPNAAIVRNPVNIKDTSVMPMPPDDVARFAFVGRLECISKGLDYLFEALGAEQWQQRRWELSLYGDGFDKQYLKELAQYYQIADKVVFAGYTNDIRKVWEKAHLLVLPSRTESAPLALVEAMLCGRPAVVTDVGGVIEWAVEPETAFVADAATTSSIGAAMERAWQAKYKWEAMGLAAHEFATKRIDPNPGRSLVNLAIQLAREE